MSGDVHVRFCEGVGVRLPRATHLVCAFQYEQDAERFYRVLGKRLGQYGLELSREKTRLLGFSRHHKDAKSRFDFLGFTFLWGKDRKGQDRLQRQTARSRLRKALGNFTAWIKQVRNHRVPALMKELNSPTTTSIVDIIAIPQYATPAYPAHHQEDVYVTILSDRRRRFFHSHV